MPQHNAKRPPRSAPGRSSGWCSDRDGNGVENIYDLSPRQGFLHAVIRLRTDIAVEVSWSASGDRRANVDFIWSRRPDPLPADVAAAFDRAKQEIIAAVGHINRALAGDP